MVVRGRRGPWASWRARCHFGRHPRVDRAAPRAARRTAVGCRARSHRTPRPPTPCCATCAQASHRASCKGRAGGRLPSVSTRVGRAAAAAAPASRGATESARTAARGAAAWHRVACRARSAAPRPTAGAQPGTRNAAPQPPPRPAHLIWRAAAPVALRRACRWLLPWYSPLNIQQAPPQALDLEHRGRPDRWKARQALCRPHPRALRAGARRSRRLAARFPISARI